MVTGTVLLICSGAMSKWMKPPRPSASALRAAGREGGGFTRDAVVEAGAHGDDQVGVAHGPVGVGRAVHAEHVERALVGFVEGAQALEGGGDGDVGRVDALAEHVGAAGEHGPLPHVEDGLLGAVDQLRGAGDLAGGAQLADVVAGQVRG